MGLEERKERKNGESYLQLSDMLDQFQFIPFVMQQKKIRNLLAIFFFLGLHARLPQSYKRKRYSFQLMNLSRVKVKIIKSNKTWKGLNKTARKKGGTREREEKKSKLFFFLSFFASAHSVFGHFGEIFVKCEK